ncbi:hypothetical protein [Pseudolabrys sp. FHR47]|uniref:hypothetical protein n=1 Tax=Pseudolabrys sp. FHR47 TaxID=2562284 RepID=UPI0010BEDEFB|nr:hypothetical protein [Pseudolabrys sp. FHR47]
MSSPPDFWEIFADALRSSARNRSWRAFFPWCLLLSVGVPVAAVVLLKQISSLTIGDDQSVTMLSSVAVVAGFLGSVSVATMTQVQRMVSEYPFSSYLKDENLFDQFLFWPQATLIFQIGLLLFSVLAAILVRIVPCINLNIYVVAVDVGLLIYVCTKTWNLIDLVRKLTWHYEDYNRLFKEFERRQKLGGPEDV